MEWRGDRIRCHRNHGIAEGPGPFGIIREGKPSVLRVDEERAAVVLQAYALAATGCTDWEVATQRASPRPTWANCRPTPSTPGV
jgi:hypothetical protein